MRETRTTGVKTWETRETTRQGGRLGGRLGDEESYEFFAVNFSLQNE
ncbi:MAG: hypothetical protein ACHBN1_07265 [Heteroscytonema crispum UTEX LB 1556]